MDESKKVTYADKDASWEMYVELNTKMTTQSFIQLYNNEPTIGDCKSALTSIYSIFPETRLILKQYGLLGKQFANLAFKMLNVKIRPFTTKWHGFSEGMDKNDFNKYCGMKFQKDLKQLQSDLAPYVAKFLEMANTKDKLLDKVEE
jgi:hypothetical protein